MSESQTLTRRRALQLFAGAPLLPLGASLSGPSFAGPAAGHGLPTQYRFGAMAAPGLANPAQMASTYVASTLTESLGHRHEGVTFRLGYETFFLTGQQVADGKGGQTLAGGYYDIHNQPIVDATDPNQRQFFSDCPDGMSLITLPRVRSRRRGHHRVFAVVQFEYASKNVAGQSLYGRLPSPIAVLALDQDRRTGKLEFVSYSNVDTSAVQGLWITCGASLSPWNTHLSSEEYEPDATTIANNSQFAGLQPEPVRQPDRGQALPLRPPARGHRPPRRQRLDRQALLPGPHLARAGPGDARRAHRADGRRRHQRRPVHVRRRQRRATCPPARCTSRSGTRRRPPTAARRDLRWVRLGHATSDEIKALADSLSASDIVDVKTADPGDASYTKIPFAGKSQWVRFKPGMEKAAAFLETHRYAAFKGGSLGFTKMEGTTVNAKDKIAYSAISYVSSAMTNGSGGIAIQGPNAGMVYAWPMTGGQADTDGVAIDSDWVPVSGSALLLGEDLAAPDALGNLAHPDKIANPDNLKFSEKMRTLFIGEDSGLHVNNFLWAYNVDTKELSRILSTPAGAESTGLHAVDDVNRFSYIMSNFQHPGDWELKKDANGNVTGGLHAKVWQTLQPLEDANYNGRFSAAVGYLTIEGRAEG